MMPYTVNIKETQKLQGNVTIGERGAQGEPGPKGERGEPGGAYIRQESIINSSASLSLLSNVYYIINNTFSDGDIEITLNDKETGLCNEFLGEITTEHPAMLVFPYETKWLASGVDIIEHMVMIEPSKTYVFSIVNGLGVVVVYE